MRKIIQKLVLVIAVAAILPSCAATNMQMRGDFKQKDEKYLDLLLEPYDACGIKEPQTGKFSCYHESFPRELNKERYIPERIKWYVIVLSQGFEYLGQLLSFNEKTAELLVDTAKALKNAKALILSTMAEKVYGIKSDAKGVDVDRGRLMSDVTYQKDLVEKYGTDLSESDDSDRLFEEISHWNRFSSPRGYILTPLDEKRFREIVSINPGYTYSQRLVNQQWIISTNLIGMVLQDGIVNNISAAMKSPNMEWRSNQKTKTTQEDKHEKK